MKHVILTIIAAASVFVLFSGCGKSKAAEAPQTGRAGERRGNKELIIYTWSEMFPEDILEGFESQTGYTINYANFDLNETMLTRLETSGGGEYDLIIADDYAIEIVIEKGLAQKLDKSKIANYKNINPMYQGQFYDSHDDYTVPYGSGVMTLIYNPALVTVPIRGYADLWDPSFAGSLGIIGNYRVINGMALKVLGESYNANDIPTIQRAGEKLLALAPNIRLIRDDDLQNELISGEITTGVMYTSQVNMAKQMDSSLEIVYPEEGIGFGIQGAFIPSQAPNPDAAHEFLNYILDPRRGAWCFEYMGYYSTFSASDPYISEENQALLTLPEGFNIDMEMIQNISAEADEEQNRIWTAFRAAAGK
jgi:spermidine/putrescine-binding protein